jgi:hypothetical protein
MIKRYLMRDIILKLTSRCMHARLNSANKINLFQQLIVNHKINFSSHSSLPHEHSTIERLERSFLSH